MSVEKWMTKIQQSQKITVVTGAGISIASGIPPFRKDKDAVWEQHVTTKGTELYLLTQPQEFWSWYNDLFGNLLTKEPNPAHHALVGLEKWALSKNKQFTLITQNVDCLHQKAGSENLFEIHGRVNVWRCINKRCLRGGKDGLLEIADVVDFEEGVPQCPICQSQVRPHVLLFDEDYASHWDYAIHPVLRSLQTADVILYIGTSFSVGFTDMAVSIATQGKIPQLGIDPSPTEQFANIDWWKINAEEGLPLLMTALHSNEAL